MVDFSAGPCTTGYGSTLLYPRLPQNALTDFWREQYDGALNNRFKLAPYSGLAAMFLESSSEDLKMIRLYGQLEDDNHIQEFCCKSHSGGRAIRANGS